MVRDNGAGIEPQLLTEVFDLFVQGERALDRGQGGLGIGLTLVKRLVELHQGRVEAASDGPGRGATFTVTLPCISAVEPQQRAGSRARSPDRIRGLRHGACWSSTTTSTPPRAPPRSCASKATR